VENVGLRLPSSPRPRVRHVESALEPRLILRPEHDECDFVRQHQDLFDIVLVPERYAAPYPEKHHLSGLDHDRLVGAVKESGGILWRDPDTPGLRSRSVSRLPPTARLRRAPAFPSAGLPLDLQSLRDAGRRNAFCDICLQAQSGSEALIPPYFDFADTQDPWFQLNLQFVRRAVEAAGEQVPTAFVQVTANRLRRGMLAEAAPSYGATGVTRAALRIRGLDAPRAAREDVRAYFDAIASFEASNIEVFADCTGRLGPVLVGGRARGFSTGTRFFQKVPGQLLSVGGGGGGQPLSRPSPGGWSDVPRDESETAAEARVLNLTTLREHMLLAARDPEALVESLRGDGSRYAAGWAAELSERLRRAA
jgi:hypothetical protein